MKKHIPNAITIGNLLAGYLSIFSVINKEYELAIFFVLIAVFFDILDGLVARMLKVSSTIGMSLDSLADLVSFGVAPSLVFYYTYIAEYGEINYLGLLLCCLYVASGAYRLARFNNLTGDDKSNNHFVGLPITFASLVVILICLLKGFISMYIALPVFLLTTYSMVAKIRVPSLKKGNIHLKLFILVTVLIALFKTFYK